MNGSFLLAEQVGSLSEAGASLKTKEEHYITAPSAESFDDFAAELEKANAILSKVEENPAAATYAADLARSTGSEVENLAGSLGEQGTLIRQELAEFPQGVRSA